MADRHIMDLDAAADDPVRWAFITGVHLLEAGRASLLLRDPDEPVLTVAASVGIDESVVPTIRVPLGQGIAGMVAERGVLFFGSHDGSTFICVPVVTDRGVEGVLNLADRLGGKQYGDEHIQPARLLAAHLAHLLGYRRRVARRTRSTFPDRTAFDEMLERELARSKRAGAPFAVALLLVANYADLQNRYGRVRAEEVVHGVGAVLERILRRYDFVGYGDGGEFALLLAGPIETESGIMARMSEAVAGDARQMGVEILLRIGVAYCPMDGTSAPALMARAEARMHERKQEKIIVPRGGGPPVGA